MAVQRGMLLPLWVVIRVPVNAPTGRYLGNAIINLSGGATLRIVQISLNVDGPPLPDGGDSEPWRGTRLAWLDSTLAQGGDGDSVPPPFLPIDVQLVSGGLRASMLDKELSVSRVGLISAATVGTSAATSHIGRLANAIEARALAKEGVQLHINGQAPERGSFESVGISTKETRWRANSTTAVEWVHPSPRRAMQAIHKAFLPVCSSRAANLL